jgi:hypothetical protein
MGMKKKKTLNVRQNLKAATIEQAVKIRNLPTKVTL